MITLDHMMIVLITLYIYFKTVWRLHQDNVMFTIGQFDYCAMII